MTTTRTKNNPEPAKQTTGDNPLSAYLPILKSNFIRNNYAPETIRKHLSASKAFGRWISDVHCELGNVDETTVARYIQSLRENQGSVYGIKKSISALPHLLYLLRKQNVIESTGVPILSESVQWLAEFDSHLLHVAGLSGPTREKYCFFINKFLLMFSKHSRPNWQLLTAEDITDFVKQEVTSRSRNSKTAPLVAIRSMLRYLIFTGEISETLLNSVPRMRKWKHESLPKYLTEDQIETLISGALEMPRATFRNYAIVLLLARFGLRAVEVRYLQFDDIDWVEGSVLISSNKTRRERNLPLPRDVGMAIVNYLKLERPKSTSRFVFLSTNAPCTRIKDSSAISRVVRQIMNYVGIDNMNAAAHLLRHSAATKMVCKGGKAIIFTGSLVKRKKYT